MTSLYVRLQGYIRWALIVVSTILGFCVLPWQVFLILILLAAVLVAVFWGRYKAKRNREGK